MGLHGEPGASTQKMQCANDIVKKVNGPGPLLSLQYLSFQMSHVSEGAVDLSILHMWEPPAD